MLAIVPYLVQHPGSELGEVAALFDVPGDQLRRDLELLFLSGLPPYGPGDLIDVEVDDDDRIWISMADHFARPLRLTRQEALAVSVRGHELLAAPGLPEAPALESALAKLRATLGETGTEGIETAVAGLAPDHLDEIREASSSHDRLRIDYVAATTGERSDRLVDPEEVFSSLGNWYVAAWDLDAEAERLFRVDRVLGIEPTGETFEPRGLAGAGRSLYTPTEQDTIVRLRLSPPARWVAEHYITTHTSGSDQGTIEVTFPAKRLNRIAGLVMRLGSSVDVLEPEELISTVRDLAERTLARYR